MNTKARQELVGIGALVVGLFLGRVMRHPDFVAGRVDTKFLEREPHLLKEQT